ncbi:hypothetical protein HXX01_02115 [Candidatus Nomurabacteria bacterium]|nr:hypothetical protein [Candidatus Nomurabacteria bacterium]
MKEVMLIKSMYPCQDIPAVIFSKRCPSPCLYCGLYNYEFSEEKTLAIGVEDVITEMGKYKGAYLSPVTDCFLPENCDLAHYLLEETWRLNKSWVPLVNTKQIIPESTIRLFIQNKERLVLQVSVSTTDEEIVSVLEPGSASVANRFEVIKKLTSAGVPVIVVVMPWFDLGNTEDLVQKVFDSGAV